MGERERESDSIELSKVGAMMRELHERLCALVPEYWSVGDVAPDPAERWRAFSHDELLVLRCGMMMLKAQPDSPAARAVERMMSESVVALCDQGAGRGAREGEGEPVITSAYEVMAINGSSGQLSVPSYPGTGDPRLEFANLAAAAAWVEHSWKYYSTYNAQKKPVVVRRGS